ncbi:DUF7144 family membrane protein [Angustibacter luteus]|uniref:DUF7144 domain-containing protein n=1 Tax=Angustibacter luteus TaxID=658456 RepID=A0ABW1JDE9_9ACTN
MSNTRSTSSPWASGASVFAGCLLLTVGVFGFFQGLIAIVNGKDFFVTTPNYFVSFDASQWGWIHLILGILVAGTGLLIFTGNVLARSVGIFLASLQALANFLWLPYYPIWGIIIIALDVFIIWGLATTRLDQE